jgi:hypothetical protein
MQTSIEVKQITCALLEAQKKIGSAIKGSKNPFFKSKYADLLSVIDACKNELNQNGIVVLQPIQNQIVQTILIHSSGEWMQSEIKIVCAKENDPQAYGSAITYARRYGLQSFILLPAEDDDGEGAMNRETSEKSDDLLNRVLSAIKKADNETALSDIKLSALKFPALDKFTDKIHDAVVVRLVELKKK